MADKKRAADAGRRGRSEQKKLKKPLDSRRLGMSRSDKESRPADRAVSRTPASTRQAVSAGGSTRRVARASSRPPVGRSGTDAAAASARSRTLRVPAGVGAGPGGRERPPARDGSARAPSKVFRLSPRSVILVLLLIVFIGFTLGPTLRNIEANSRLKEKDAELKKQRSSTESLEREVEEAGSMRYVEEEARKQRMVAPGEVLYIVTSDDDASRIEYRVKNLQSMEEAWEHVKRMLNCSYPGDKE